MILRAFSAYVSFLSHFAILAGYLFLAVFVAPRFTVQLRTTKIGGVGFFLLCGITHGGLMFTAEHRDMAGPWWTVLHFVQALAVWAFVIGLYIESGRFGGLSAEPFERNENDS